MVLDAGSTKTKLYLYEYRYVDSLPYEIITETENKVEPGVADVDNIDLDSYLRTIFNDNLVLTIAQFTITEGKTIDDPLLSGIQFYSTAGIRALPESEQATKNAYIDAWIKNWLTTNSIAFNGLTLDVRTLPGEEEASYGWVAVNYLENAFQGTLFGSAEIGGASTQIAYQDDAIPNVSINVANTQYSITGYSYPLGQNVIIDDLYPLDACNLKGYTDTATGDYAECRIAAKTMIDATVTVNTPNAMDVAYYDLLSNYVNSAEFFGLEDDYSLTALQSAAETFCELTWTQAQADSPDVSTHYLPYYCMGAAYQAALLEDSYYLSDAYQTFDPVDSINGTDVDWTIGVLATQSFTLLSE
ncbi:hypothetical protein [Shewanella surugensis]|uniref:Ectonucleoside triphosphate diphosphohydrolase n=1 Tax=Shewanella surugensis TaxID=212020 RepID=A0ABT0LAC9_9GAMM|nr:hypothetical protein [Shewanella surugensis]MCL1124315.1 hypothetical protein [Shewanella surugensis]